jgi:RNA polymerase sigma-70 factor, ECF subfamily
VERLAREPVTYVRETSEQSFSDLFGPLIQPGYRLACALVHNPQLAEDVVQEASLIAWRKIKTLEARSKARAWFFGIVANECRNARRRRWWKGVTIGLPPNLSVVSDEERWATNADVRKGLRKLSHDDRLIVSLFFYLDLPVDEVAAVLGINVDAARKRLYRAIHRLRPDLDVEEALR